MFFVNGRKELDVNGVVFKAKWHCLSLSGMGVTFLLMLEDFATIRATLKIFICKHVHVGLAFRIGRQIKFEVCSID